MAEAEITNNICYNNRKSTKLNFSGEGIAIAIDRIKTGIPGLDEGPGVGLPFPSITLAVEDTGKSKTTFCNQVLCEGARSGGRGIFFVIFGGLPE
jgi:hypothetical protein